MSEVSVVPDLHHFHPSRPDGGGATLRAVRVIEDLGRVLPDPEVDEAAARLRCGRCGYRGLKRSFDVLFSVTVMVCFSWLFVLIAVLIKLEEPRGSVLFSQTRVGRDGREFRMWKFRSMVMNAESHLAQLQALNEKSGPVFKMTNDPRVTRVGRVIRQLSLDELPQFWNVLTGDISLVGPRPALPSEVEEYTPADRQRLLVHQGMTCYWQTRLNRDAVSFAEWMELDRLYVKQCGIWADFKLIIQTIGVMLAAQGR